MRYLSGRSQPIQPNLDSPLFINTVGSWQFRPRTKTRIDNLRSMGIKANVGPIPLRMPARLLLLLLKYLGFPFVAPFGLWYWFRRHVSEAIR